MFKIGKSKKISSIFRRKSYPKWLCFTIKLLKWFIVVFKDIKCDLWIKNNFFQIYMFFFSFCRFKHFFSSLMFLPRRRRKKEGKNRYQSSLKNLFFEFSWCMENVNIICPITFGRTATNHPRLLTLLVGQNLMTLTTFNIFKFSEYFFLLIFSQYGRAKIFGGLQSFLNPQFRY